MTIGILFYFYTVCLEPLLSSRRRVLRPLWGGPGTQSGRRGLRRNLPLQLHVSRDSAPIAALSKRRPPFPLPVAHRNSGFRSCSTHNVNQTINGHPNDRIASPRSAPPAQPYECPLTGRRLTWSRARHPHHRRAPPGARSCSCSRLRAHAARTHVAPPLPPPTPSPGRAGCAAPRPLRGWRVLGLTGAYG